MKSKKLVIFLTAIIITTGNYYLISSERQETNNKNIQKDPVYEELADKYNARIDWEENLHYTIQAQERLTPNIPIIFEGFVDNLFIRYKRTFITLNNWFGRGTCTDITIVV